MHDRRIALYHPPARWPELYQARFICGPRTFVPADEVSLRFRPCDTGVEPALARDGSVALTMREIHGR
jgi:hypothetical protein